LLSISRRVLILSPSGHCKRLAPVWEDLGNKLRKDHEDLGINIAKIDLTENKEIQKRFDIKGYPTLLFFADRKMYKYKQKRDLETMIEFATGGYKDSDTEPIPGAPSGFDAIMFEVRKAVGANPIVQDFIDDFKHIIDLRKNAAAALLILGFVFGLIFGAIFSSCGKSRKSERAQKSKKE